MFPWSFPLLGWLLTTEAPTAGTHVAPTQVPARATIGTGVGLALVVVDVTVCPAPARVTVTFVPAWRSRALRGVEGGALDPGSVKAANSPGPAATKLPWKAVP